VSPRMESCYGPGWEPGSPAGTGCRKEYHDIWTLRPPVSVGILPVYMDRPEQQAISDASQVDRAYREIKAGIVEGRYLPGAPMSEVMLAREHSMSRPPVREGLARLWQEQYLDRVQGHGYFVARVTVQSIHETFDVRRVIEG